MLLHGPERIQRSWWQTEATFRDYYIARHHQGSECWVYREHQGQGESLEPSLKNNIHHSIPDLAKIVEISTYSLSVFFQAYFFQTVRLSCFLLFR